MQMVWKEHFVIWITPNFPFHNHSDFAWVITRRAQIKTEKKTTPAKARGDNSLRWMPSQGLTTLGAEQTVQRLPKKLFLFCVLSIWLKLSKRVHFLTWKVFKTPKGLGKEGDNTQPGQIFFSGQKKASKTLITNLLQTIYGPIQRKLSFVYQ